MNAHDQANLDFLLNIPILSLCDWFRQASEDDRAYAHELLALYAQELSQARVEQDLEAMPSYDQALTVLARFR